MKKFVPIPELVYTFKAVTWDCLESTYPLVIYSPIKFLTFTDSFHKYNLVQEIERVCLKICVDGYMFSTWNNSLRQEFKSRNWNTRFSQRKGIHLHQGVRFFSDKEGFAFELLNPNKIY